MTYVERAVSLFQHAPYVWFGAPDLQRELGFCAWRSRVSDARKRGLHIENRIVVRPDGTRLSYYRYLPERTAPHAVPHV